MAKVKKVNESGQPRRIRPALSVEAREMQMTYLAMELAEKQLQEGTASSQVITHFLKLGSKKEKLELEKLEEENKMLRAKTKAYESAEDSKVLLEKALKAFTEYSGGTDEDELY